VESDMKIIRKYASDSVQYRQILGTGV